MKTFCFDVYKVYGSIFCSHRLTNLFVLHHIFITDADVLFLNLRGGGADQTVLNTVQKEKKTKNPMSQITKRWIHDAPWEILYLAHQSERLVLELCK